MGSQTTPPCDENTYHLVFTKPLIISGCQFKLLRQNSLISYKPKNIHARIDQPISDRILYRYNSLKIKYFNDITSTLPQAYNKYLFKISEYDKINNLQEMKDEDKDTYKMESSKGNEENFFDFPKEVKESHKINW
jgi:hypothetical protein